MKVQCNSCTPTDLGLSSYRKLFWNYCYKEPYCVEKRVETSLQSSLPRRISFCDFSVGQDRRGERISLFDGVQEVREIQSRRGDGRRLRGVAIVLQRFKLQSLCTECRSVQNTWFIFGVGILRFLKQFLQGAGRASNPRRSFDAKTWSGRDHFMWWILNDFDVLEASPMLRLWWAQDVHAV